MLTSTAVDTLATAATRNPGLILASGVMGTLFALQRRASGGIQAPILTHLTWSTLILRYLPRYSRTPPSQRNAQPSGTTLTREPPRLAVQRSDGCVS